MNLFYVPNTILAAYAFNPDLQNSTFHWDDNMYNLERLGFKIVYFNNTLYATAKQAKNTFLSYISFNSENKYLHGLYLEGHGNDGYFSFGNNSTWGPKWSVAYSQNNFYVDNENVGAPIVQMLNYKLGAFVAHACYSQSNVDDLTSRHSVKWGAPGVVISKALNVVEFWGTQEEIRGGEKYCTYGGKQGTNTFTVHLENEDETDSTF